MKKEKKKKIHNAPPSQYALPPNALPSLLMLPSSLLKKKTQKGKKKRKQNKQTKKGEVVREVNDGHEQPLF